jgi:hypothetical protein
MHPEHERLADIGEEIRRIDESSRVTVQGYDVEVRRSGSTDLEMHINVNHTDDE